jgi:hypothetical protein
MVSLQKHNHTTKDKSFTIKSDAVNRYGCNKWRSDSVFRVYAVNHMVFGIIDSPQK